MQLFRSLPMRAASIVISSLALALAACASRPVVQSEAPLPDLRKHRSVQVQVDGSAEARSKTGFEPTAEALGREFIANLRSGGRFVSVDEEATPERTLLVRLTIEDLNYVHGAARGLTGAFAGRALLKVQLGC